MLNEPERLQCALYPVRSSLVWRQDRQPDGWGLGFFQGGEVLLQKRPRPALGPVDFYALVRGLRTDCIVGHVRLATVGKHGRSENTHPYRFRSWLFAHHGTIDKFNEVRPAIMEHIPDFLRRNVRGQTDSEHLMHLFLSFLHDSGRLDDANLPAGEAANALGATLRLVDRHTEEVGGTPSGHSMIITNGRVMVALRRGEPIYYYRIKGIADCALCRESQGDFARESRRVPHEHLRGVAIIGGATPATAPWEEVPEGSALAVSHDLTFEVKALGAA
jgi:glutamine amidotransferase